MKIKKFFKSLLSMALAVIITASVCVCGFSVAAATDDVTVNFFDGTTPATYTGSSTDGMLSSSAGITGILEEQSVARLVPQYSYAGPRQINVGISKLEEGTIDYAAAKTLYLYVKNDLDSDIQWRMSEYAETDSKLGTTYHNLFFTSNTEFTV